MRKINKGFTLIELLIVIAIIGILASVVLVSLSGAREKAQIAAYKVQVRSFQAAALLACDSDADGDLAVGDVAEPASGSRLAGINWGNADNCGVNGTGTFSILMESTNLGAGAAALGCAVNDTTAVTENGVVFNIGC